MPLTLVTQFLKVISKDLEEILIYLEIIGKVNVLKATLKHLYILLIISGGNLKEFQLDSIIQLLMIIIMCFIAGVEIVLDNLVKVLRIWNLPLRSCMNRRCLKWSKDAFIGSRLFKFLVGGNIVLHLL